MKRITMSKTQLVPECLYWLRDEAEHAWDEPGLPAIEGTFVHAMVEAHGTGGDVQEVDAPAGIDEDKCVRMYRCWVKWADDTDPNGTIRHEVALAYNPETGKGRELAKAHHRDYSDVKPGEIAGTLDGVSCDGTTITVRDWKTGKPVSGAAKNMQLTTGMLAARCLYPQASRFVVELVYLNDEGRPAYVDSAELDEMDLDAARADLRHALKMHATAQPKPGPHCTQLYCPARGTCPATVAAMAGLAEVTTQSIEAIMSRSIKGPDDAARVWPLLVRAEELLKAARGRIASIVERQPVALASGHVLRMTEPSTRETFSKARIPASKRDEVMADLRAMGAVSETTSKGYMKEYAK